MYLAETASIGDIGVVFQSPEGEIKYAPEKIETVIRTLLAQAAEQRGWSRGLLLKMTAHKQTLYRVTRPDATVEYVIEDDLPEFLARHPGIDPRRSEAGHRLPRSGPPPHPDRARSDEARHGDRQRRRPRRDA